MKKRIFAILMSLVMLLSIIPMTVLAGDTDDHSNQVRVIVENTTFSAENADDLGATWEDSFWTGTLVDVWVDIDETSTMMGCIQQAIEDNGYTQEGAENNYLSSINGLGEFDGGWMSGWMGTLNDWFTNAGFAEFTVSNGTLEAGDEIRVMYTCSYGEDIGGSWSNNETTLKALAFSNGVLSPAFSSDVTEYTLTVPSTVSGVIITPTATNKNFEVRTTVDGTVYKRTATVPIKNGSVVVIECNFEGSRTMNSGADTSTYTINVVSVTDVVTALPDAASITLTDKTAVDAALSAYNSLTDEQKTQISAADKAKLDAAAAKIAELTYSNVYKETGEYILGLCNQYTPVVGSIGGEWAIIGLARSGIGTQEIYDGWYKNVLSTVESKINDKEQLHRTKSTENERVILALTAAGFDVTDVAGHNLIKGLTDLNYLKKQGINGPIWGLLAFDSHAFEIPADDDAVVQATRENIIEYILSKRIANAGWALSGKNSDPDMTGMAIQALAPYYNTNAEVKTAIDEALDCMSALQKDDAGFASWGTVNSESCAQMIVALTALGIDPTTDARFIKNGRNLIDALCDFALPGGGFRHIMSQTDPNGMATEQGYYALAAYYRLKNGQTSLYNMTDVHIYDADHTFDYVSDETSHWLECTCGEKSGVAEAHTFSEWQEVTPATATGEGKMERVCSVCGATESKSIQKLAATTITDNTPLAGTNGAAASDTGAAGETVANTYDSTSVILAAAAALVPGVGAMYVTAKRKKSNEE